MIQADRVHSTPLINTSATNVVKFPFDVSRRAHARKLRRSKNGTPEERSGLQEAAAASGSPRTSPAIVGGSDYEERRKSSAETITQTAMNSRLRHELKEAWRMAGRAVDYWRARLDLESAVSCAQSVGIPEGELHPATEPDDRWELLRRWRGALGKQLLTPAPDAAAIKWKQALLAGDRHCYTGAAAEQIERSIAADMAFLAAHPVRHSKRKTGGAS